MKGLKKMKYKVLKNDAICVGEKYVVINSCLILKTELCDYSNCKIQTRMSNELQLKIDNDFSEKKLTEFLCLTNAYIFVQSKKILARILEDVNNNPIGIDNKIYTRLNGEKLSFYKEKGDKWNKIYFRYKGQLVGILMPLSNDCIDFVIESVKEWKK